MIVLGKKLLIEFNEEKETKTVGGLILKPSFDPRYSRKGTVVGLGMDLDATLKAELRGKEVFFQMAATARVTENRYLIDIIDVYGIADEED